MFSLVAGILGIAGAEPANLCEYDPVPAYGGGPVLELFRANQEGSKIEVKATCPCMCTTAENSIFLFELSTDYSVLKGWSFDGVADLKPGKRYEEVISVERLPSSEQKETAFKLTKGEFVASGQRQPMLNGELLAPWRDTIVRFLGAHRIERQHILALGAFQSKKPGLAASMMDSVRAEMSSGNTEILNDYGFFLEQANRAPEAISVLERVVAFDPTRTPAYLNLADAYQKSGDNAKAKANYQKYVELMEKAGKAAKVPARVRAILKP